MSSDSNFQPVPAAFFAPSAEIVAPRLLGHWLLRRTPEGISGGPIVETEAYLSDDPACHAFRGRTRRNRSMWGPPGRAYVYLIYGCHHCVNAVCSPAGVGEAVLIRAIEPLLGSELMRLRRFAPDDLLLTNGPAKLCEALHIDRTLDGIDLCDPHSPLFIARDPRGDSAHSASQKIVVTERIGLTKATGLPLRFLFASSPSVSKRSAARVQVT